MKVFTKSISGTLTVSADMNVMQISVLMQASSTATLLGNQAILGLTPDAIDLAAGEGFTLQASSSNSPIDGLVLTVTSGNADVIIALNI